MEFSTNSPFLYLLAVIVILFVLAQSVFFLVRAYRRGKALGMDAAKLKKTILSTSVFTIAPAVSILLGVVTLAKFLGIPLPWIRLSVIGALTYELPAATSTATALNVSLSEMVTDPKVYSAIAWVMTLGILPSIILPPILMKKIQSGLVKIKNKDRVAANKAKSQQTTVRATKAMTRPAHLTSPRRNIPTCGRRTPSSRA